MDNRVVQKLFAINEKFYRDYGDAFAETRRRIQPGVRRILEGWIHDGSWLDLGCGSGALSAAWAQKSIHGWYEGLDFSPVLIAAARKAGEQISIPSGLNIKFTEVNLSNLDWTSSCSLAHYDGILMFASLHHIPGVETRLRLVRQIASLLPPGALFIHSEWQFQNDPKLLARVQPWSLVNLPTSDVEEGDTLLDWRRTLPGQDAVPGLRYVHLFTSAELAELSSAGGFEIFNEFRSDGAGGDLSLYQVWRRI